MAAAFLAGAFLAADFFEVAFLAVDFLAADFFAADFFTALTTVFLLYMESRRIGSHAYCNPTYQLITR